MKWRIGVFCVAMCMPIVAAWAAPLTGLYRTIDDETGAAKSIVRLYEYKNDEGADMLAGRIVALYDADGTISETPANATRVASKVSGNPRVVGLDIIWDMKWSDKTHEYSGGRIMDPASGKVYSSVIWADGDKLNVRGKIGPFGRTQVWQPLADVPASLRGADDADWTPVIRK